MRAQDISRPARTSSDIEARRALKAILESKAFSRSKRGSDLLAYLVERTLDGRGAEIKAFSIACDVFDRSERFDADHDALVRVQAMRLRNLLEEYYADEGRNEALRISIPKGGYVPIFQFQTEEPQPTDPPTLVPAIFTEKYAAALASAPLLLLLLSMAALIAVAAVSFPAYLGSPAKERADKGLRETALSIAFSPIVKSDLQISDRSLEIIQTELKQLSKLSFIEIFSERILNSDASLGDAFSAARRHGAHYLLEGHLSGTEGALAVNVDIVDVKSGQYIWTQTYTQKSAASVKSVDNLALSVLTGLHLVLRSLSSRDAESVNLETATPRELYFLATWIPGRVRNSLAWEKERVALAKRAIRIDPSFGPAYSVLADKVSFLAEFDRPSDTRKAQDDAQLYANRAMEYAPTDADVVFNVALHHWHAGNLDDAVVLMRRTAELAPYHPMAGFLADAFPYSCAAPANGVTEKLIAYDLQLQPNNPVRWVTLGWVGTMYFNAGDFPRAIEYTRRSIAVFPTPDMIYRLAAAFVQVKDLQAARKLVEGQKEYWPNLDPSFFADVVIPRRCRDAPGTGFSQGIYQAFARALATPNPPTGSIR